MTKTILTAAAVFLATALPAMADGAQDAAIAQVLGGLGTDDVICARPMSSLTVIQADKCRAGQEMWDRFRANTAEARAAARAREAEVQQASERAAGLRASGYHDRGETTMRCPSGTRLTAKDGCQ